MKSSLAWREAMRFHVAIRHPASSSFVSLTGKYPLRRGDAEKACRRSGDTTVFRAGAPPRRLHAGG